MAKSDSKKAFDKRVKQWKVNKQEGEKKAKQEKHFSANQKVIGRITKGNAYAKNGYFQVDGMPGRKKVYERATTKSKNYGAGNDNFFSLKLPYPLQAHHILPKDSFSTKLGFTEPQRNLLKRAPWDINHGENIIFLPEDENNCPIHRLPSHLGSHPTYNTDVYNDTKAIKSKLKQQPPCSTEAPQLKILEELKGYQDDWWDWLANKCYAKQQKGSVEDAAVSGV
jgi:hypothetical protein